MTKAISEEGHRNLFIKIFGFLILFFGSLFLTSCQSTNETDATMYRGDYEVTYVYHEASNQTEVTWGCEIENNTIYKMDEFSASFELYNDTTCLEKVRFYYTVDIANGGSYSGKYIFDYDGKVTKAEFVSWTAHYLSVWDTYKAWFISMIVIASVGAVIYIIVMIIEDLDLEDTWDAITDSDLSMIFAIGLPVLIGGGSIVGSALSYWVPVLIVLGGIVAFILVALFGHLVKFIVE